jgi:hypothetical protein
MAKNDIGLNSTALFTIAKTMRDQNPEPDQLMPHSEYAAASGTYAVIKAMESLAGGLWVEEERQLAAARQRYLFEIEAMREESKWREELHNG